LAHPAREMALAKIALFACALVLVLAAVGDCAFPHARWTRPTGVSEQGDRRYLMQKYMRQVVEDAREPPTVPPLVPYRRKSRSYHFAYGPIYPTHHEHITEGEKWYPLDHQLYY
jgi:hypothetical protein